MKKFDNTKTRGERKREEEKEKAAERKKFVRSELIYSIISIVFIVIIIYFLFGYETNTTFGKPDPSVITEGQ